MKFVNTRPFADPEVAALKIVDLANAVEPYFDNRILIEKINGPFLYELRALPRGRELVMLGDAGNYITKLPKAPSTRRQSDKQRRKP